MDTFECNSIEDLVFYRSFREWVMKAQSEDAVFWENWVLNNPDKTELVNQSKAVIYALQLNLKGLPEESIQYEISKILQKLHANERADYDLIFEEENKRRLVKRRIFQFVVAASGIIFLSVFLMRNSFQKKPPVSYVSFLSEKKSGTVEQVNNSDTTQIIVLPDASTVYLRKQSTLHYAHDPTGKKREVFLTGAAFFKVEKDPLRPFFVYTSSVVTKVLGTSFSISAYPSDSKAVITVNTGKVSVFRAPHFDDGAANGTVSGGVVLTPNQEVIYTNETNDLNKKLAEKPIVIDTPSKNAFVFDATPVRRVFKVMQEIYYVPIVYDEEIMAGCSLSASMGDEPFYDKLNLICKAIDASYEMIDGQIVIISKGCKPQSINK